MTPHAMHETICPNVNISFSFYTFFFVFFIDYVNI